MNKEAKLREHLKSLGSAALAFSGGVDSALLAYVANQELGKNFTAVTVRSPLISEKDLGECVQFCKTYGISHRIIDVDIVGDPDFAANDSQRCYHCKQNIFSAVKGFAADHGLKQVIDGTNIEDCPNRRPGMRVLIEQSIQSPLRQCGFAKQDIRALSRQLDLFTWDKESDSCLATRIPTGSSITLAALDVL